MMNEPGGWCLKRSSASPRSTSLADTYATVMIGTMIEARVTMTKGNVNVSFWMGSIRAATKGTVATGMIVTARDATRQSTCCVKVGKR